MAEGTCSQATIERYNKRLSGPLLDRIDIHLDVPRVPYEKLSDSRAGEPSAAVRARVEAARAVQAARFAGSHTATNAEMSPAQVRKMFARELKAMGGDSSERELRVVHVEALMELWRALYPAAVAGDLDAVDRFVRVEERVARLLGLDLTDQAQRPAGTDAAMAEIDGVGEGNGERPRRFVRSD